jgi:hypothetical protein
MMAMPPPMMTPIMTPNIEQSRNIAAMKEGTAIGEQVASGILRNIMTRRRKKYGAGIVTYRK